MYQPIPSLSEVTPLATQHAERATFLQTMSTRAEVYRRFDFLAGVKRRIRREQRRRKVGRAYDMALEIARLIPSGSEVLDVGCGNGFIAHHLSGLTGSSVLGIDVDGGPETAINYRRFDGINFPVPDQSVDAVLLCYVLHHAQSLSALLSEITRTVRAGGTIVVYEDNPVEWIDRLFCGIHDRKWRNRTGPCTFRSEDEWREIFVEAGFEVVKTRPLSRWRNLSHPVSRRLYLLRATKSTTPSN